MSLRVLNYKIARLPNYKILSFFQRRIHIPQQISEVIATVQHIYHLVSYLRALFHYGNALRLSKKYDEAIAQYREVLQADAGHREAKANLAAAEKRKGG